jgi:hypothetical protein
MEVEQLEARAIERQRVDVETGCPYRDIERQSRSAASHVSCGRVMLLLAFATIDCLLIVPPTLPISATPDLAWRLGPSSLFVRQCLENLKDSDTVASKRSCS